MKVFTMESDFKADAKIAEIAEAYSLDAVDVAASNFRVKLDWSEASIERFESMLKMLHEQMSSAKPDEKTIWMFAKAFGSYIGEVFRQHHGGKWGMVKLGGDEFPGIGGVKGGSFWPWGRVHQRLV